MTQREKRPTDKFITADSWQCAVSSTFFPLETTVRSDDFEGKMQTWKLGDIGLSSMRSDAILYKRHKRHFLNEVDNSLLITIPKIGSVGFEQGKRTASCLPGGFLVERGDIPYEFWHNAENELLVLKVSAESVRARIGSTDRFGALSFDGRAGVANFFLDTVQATAAYAETLDNEARGVAGKHLLDLLCLAIQSDDRVLHSNISSVRAAHLHRAEQFIRDNLALETLSSKTVAEACNLSQRYLQKLFNDSDKSITEFIREKRLIRAHEDLTFEPSISIAQIAHKWGFAEQSSFSKLYRAQFGCTPSDTRKRAVTNNHSPPG